MPLNKTFIVAATAAATTLGPFKLNNRPNGDSVKTIAVNCSSDSDTLTLLVAPVDQDAKDNANTITVHGGAYVSLQEHIDFFVTVSTYTGKTFGTLEGPWAAFKLVKAGTSGPATFYLTGV